MKNLKTIFVVMIALFVSCKKESTHSPLTGKWELTSEVSGLNGAKTEFASGKGNISTFTDTEYEIIREGKTVSKGTYSIMNFQSVQTQKEEKRIVYDGKVNDLIKNYFTIIDNTLIISVDGFDTPASIYTKL